MRPAYLEPRTDVPAKDDWSTGLIIEDLKLARTVLSIIAVVASAALVPTVVFLPMTGGNITAIVIMSIAVLVGAIGPLMHYVETLAVRRGLYDEPWRRADAALVLREDNKYSAYVHLKDDDIVLEALNLDDCKDMIREREEVFVCGPNANGKAVLRVAGFAETHNVKLDKDGNYGAEDVEEPYEIARPLDDPAVVKASGGIQAGEQAWIGSAVPGVIGAIMITWSLNPLGIAGLVVGGLLVFFAVISIPSAVEAGRWYRDGMIGLREAQQWTPVAVTLFPWKPGTHVAGLATMAGGKLALVQFIEPELHVIANIADTGVMWIAGSHEDVVVVGMPKVPKLVLAVVQPDEDTPKEQPVPWIQRLRQPDFTKVPSLR